MMGTGNGQSLGPTSRVMSPLASGWKPCFSSYIARKVLASRRSLTASPDERMASESGPKIFLSSLESSERMAVMRESTAASGDLKVCCLEDEAQPVAIAMSVVIVKHSAERIERRDIRISCRGVERKAFIAGLLHRD